MPTAPYSDLRLKPGEHPDQAKLQFLFEGLAENFEDLYERISRFEQGLGIEAAFATKRTIAGQVNSLGVKAIGSGFTCSKVIAGEYKVVLTTQLSTPGIITGNCVGVAAALVPITAESKKEWIVQTLALGTTPSLTAATFNFNIRQS